MTTKLAITGKSGSGKTTITKAFLRIFQELFPEKSILLFDNDLTSASATASDLISETRFTESEAENMNTKQEFRKE